MKIALTSQGKDLDSDMDPKFGRAAYILIVDTETLEFEALDNSENVNSFRGAGTQAAAMVGNSGAKVLLTGHCGPNAFKTLDAAGVKVVNDVMGTVRSAVKEFDYDKATFAQGADAESYS
ncbi:MAG: NifB/NifX family molybdenum-iron cluster-binding protein [Desulfobacteraceae bacterium]|nr:NifB/NifX family molybdenum-iron cluster-binding protein [Desulfobacteraceae bacterium]